MAFPSLIPELLTTLDYLSSKLGNTENNLFVNNWDMLDCRLALLFSLIQEKELKELVLNYCFLQSIPCLSRREWGVTASKISEIAYFFFLKWHGTYCFGAWLISRTATKLSEPVSVGLFNNFLCARIRY